MKTDQLLADTKTIRYEETDLTSLISTPYHFRCGIYLICTRGKPLSLPVCRNIYLMNRQN